MNHGPGAPWNLHPMPWAQGQAPTKDPFQDLTLLGEVSTQRLQHSWSVPRVQTAPQSPIPASSTLLWKGRGRVLCAPKAPSALCGFGCLVSHDHKAQGEQLWHQVKS